MPYKDKELRRAYNRAYYRGSLVADGFKPQVLRTLEEKRVLRDAYYQKNKTRITAKIKDYQNKNQNRVSAWKRKYVQHQKQKNPNYCAEKSRASRAKNPEYDRLWYRANREKVMQSCIKSFKKRLMNDPLFRMEITLRKRLNNAMRAIKLKRSARATDMLGCTLEEFKLHIERQFSEEMTWENYGTVWEIDHRVPCARWDLSNPNHQRLCFHFSNLQPLGRVENRKKGKRVLEAHQLPLLATCPP